MVAEIVGRDIFKRLNRSLMGLVSEELVNLYPNRDSYWFQL